jgi:hypothetical protein
LRSKRPPLTIKQILDWADAHHAQTGAWPNAESGPIIDAPGEVWQNITQAMKEGRRGLPDKRTLAQLLVAERGVRKRAYAPRLTVKKILRWADAHHKRTGAWPHADSGPVLGSPPGETWIMISLALQKGIRGLQKSTLPQLLAEHRGVRNNRALPRLTVEQILAWADAHRALTGRWPSSKSGRVLDAAGESWDGVYRALFQGFRGLPGNSSLSQLLAQERGVRNQSSIPPLTEGQILQWAEAFRLRNGHWPQQRSGSVDDAPGEIWKHVDHALRKGYRGLPGGSSLARLCN